MTRVEALANYFKARPHVWIDGMELSKVAGSYAWRSRVSELRTKRGMQIENRQRKSQSWSDFTISEYRYVPAEQARKAG